MGAQVETVVVPADQDDCAGAVADDMELPPVMILEWIQRKYNGNRWASVDALFLICYGGTTPVQGIPYGEPYSDS